MGRTYRRNGDDYNSYGKSLREKRQRGNIRNNGQDYDYAPKNERTKTGTQKDHSTMMETSMDLIDYPEYDDSYEYDVDNDCVFEYE